MNRGASSKAAPALKIDVTGATRCAEYNPNNASGQDPTKCDNAPFASTPTETTLVFEPTYTQDAIQAGTLDTLGAGNKWWSTRGIQGAKNRSTFVPFQTILDANPGMQILRIYIDAGENSDGNVWRGFDGTVDWVNLGFAGNDVAKFDFGG